MGLASTELILIEKPYMLYNFSEIKFNKNVNFRVEQLKGQWDDIRVRSAAREKDLEENNLTQKVTQKHLAI